MRTYEFTLFLSGVSELMPELSNALYQAAGGDIELEMPDRIVHLRCQRQAATPHDAILSMITDVEGAGVGVRVGRVAFEPASTVTDINAALWESGTSSLIMLDAL